MNGQDARKFLEDLVTSPEFIEALGPLVAKKMSLRMADRECALRFIAFLDGGVERYRKSDTDLDGFLNAAMVKVNKMAVPDRQALAARFRRAMRFAHSCFGKLAFRKPSAGGLLNKSLFESTAVALDGRSDAELERLATRQDALIEAYKIALAKPDVFQSVTASTGDAKRVSCRFDALQSLIAEAIQ
jgi:hypothetical protein